MNAVDLTSSSEKSDIRIFCDKAFSRLKGSDRNLPQVFLYTFLAQPLLLHAKLTVSGLTSFFLRSIGC